MTMRHGRLGLLVVIMSAMLLAAACGPLSKSQDETKDKQSSTAEAEDQQKLAEKYMAYTNISLYINDKLEQSLQFYFGKFGAGEELAIDPTKTNMENGIFLDLNKYVRDLEGSAQYPQQSPSLDKLDEAADALFPKLQELTANIAEADSYYKMKSYVDDGMAKGKELHSSIYAGYQETLPLIQSFDQEYNNHFMSLSAQKLGAFEQKDELVRYYSLKSIVSAIELEAALPPKGTPVNVETEMDRDLLQQNYQTLVDDLNQFIELSKDAERIKAEGIDSSFAYVNNFKVILTRLKAAATDVKIAAAAEGIKQDESAASSYGKNKETEVLDNYRIKIKESILQYWTLLEKGK
ncbi:DUF3829 domain-containing protein [Paenibacillus sp. CAU 1782]